MASNQLPPDRQSDLSYHQQIKRDFGRMIDSLDIQDLQKEYLKSRWLDQVMWLEGRASRMRNRYHWLRLVTIVGSAIIPVMVALNLFEDKTWDKVLKAGTAIIGAGVTIASSSEAFFRYGDRWYHYRRSAELLKSQGWEFFELSGSYNFPTHAEAWQDFTHQVEEIIRRDVEVYVTEGLRNRPPENPQGQPEV